DYDVKFGADPFEQLRIERGSFSVVVGALVPYIKTLMKNGADFKILELDKSTLKEAELPFYLPASEAASVVPRADNVIITATTLINDTLGGLLRLKKSGAKLVLVGPTTPLLPQALFERGVDFAGGTLVRDADAVLDIIAQAGSGYHFLGKFADKITICKG
uniref:Rossmann-like domain-containing protein n=1 Tax=uncultured Campylobacter sp. TaxID=218934 RepID=UPI00261F742F